MIGQFVTTNLATLHCKTIISLTTRQPVAPHDPEVAIGLNHQTQVVEGGIASAAEVISKAVDSTTHSLGLVEISEIQRDAVRGGQGLAKQCQVVIWGHSLFSSELLIRVMACFVRKSGKPA